MRSCMFNEEECSDSDTESGKNGLTRRRALMASSGLGSAVFGVPTVTAHGFDQNGTELTEDELLAALKESDHIIVDPDVNQQFGEEAPKIQDLDKSNTPGRGHPDIYYGKNKNAEPPSGTFYEIIEEGEEDDQTLPLAVGGGKSDDVVQPYVTDLFTVEEELGSTKIRGEKVTVSVKAGLRFSAKSDVKIGGEIFLDISLSALGQTVKVSPGGFGFWAGPDKYDGYCLEPSAKLPSWLPKVDIRLCGEIRVYTRGDGTIPDEFRLAMAVGALDICADPCPAWDCTACGTVVSTGVELKLPWIGYDTIS